MILVNGRGQLGERLSKVNFIKSWNATIYHTWDMDKSEENQKKSFEKFIKYVDENRDKKIIFISTRSLKHDAYVKYKRLAETYLLETSRDSLVIRLPLLIGKGTCENFKKDTAKPFGQIELLTIDKAVEYILDNLCFNGILECPGEFVSAELVYNLIKFGGQND